MAVSTVVASPADVRVPAFALVCSVLLSRILKRRTAALLEGKGLVTTSVITPEDEENEADAWLACARSSLRCGDTELSAVAARKVLERRPLSQLATPTRTMLARCGDDEVAALIKRRAEQAMVFHISVWHMRTKDHRRIWNATVRRRRQRVCRCDCLAVVVVAYCRSRVAALCANA